MTAETVYPPTIDGYIEVVATGERVPVAARRTGEVEDGAEVYVVDAVVPLRAFQNGRVMLHFDVMPAMSTFRVQFVREDS